MGVSADVYVRYCRVLLGTLVIRTDVTL